jgi:transcriptional regulator with XRE-family HTH domain
MPSAPTCPAESSVGLPLGKLRRQLGLSQIAMADRLQVSQPNIAQFENKEDMHLTTLRRYIEALGGRLEIVARFPGSSVEITLPESTQKSPDYPSSQPQSGRTSC